MKAEKYLNNLSKDQKRLIKGLTIDKIIYRKNHLELIIFKEPDEEGYLRTINNSNFVEDYSQERYKNKIEKYKNNKDYKIVKK